MRNTLVLLIITGFLFTGSFAKAENIGDNGDLIAAEEDLNTIESIPDNFDQDANIGEEDFNIYDEYDMDDNWDADWNEELYEDDYSDDITNAEMDNADF